MGLLDGWPFKSKEQMERERKEFERRIFPLGEAQRAKAAAVLGELMNPRLKADEQLYAFISAKDKYTLYYLDGDEDRAAIEAKAVLQQQKWLSNDDRLAALALVRLELNLDSLDDYPTPDKVRKEMVLLA